MPSANSDRLLKTLFDEYRLNLLRPPRAAIEPGQLLLRPIGSTDVIGPVSAGHFFETKPWSIKTQKGTPVANVDITYSNVREAHAQVGVFGALLTTFAPWLSNTKMTIAGGTAATARFRFSFSNATMDTLDVCELQKITKALPTKNSLETNQAFVIVDVFRSSSVVIEWVDDSNNSLSAEAVSGAIAQVSGSRKIAVIGENKILVEGPSPLAFGVRTIEIGKNIASSVPELLFRHTYLDVRGRENKVDVRDYSKISQTGWIDLVGGG